MARGSFPIKAIRSRIAHLQSELRLQDVAAPDQKRTAALRALIRQNQTRLAMLETKLGLQSESASTSVKSRKLKSQRAR